MDNQINQNLARTSSTGQAPINLPSTSQPVVQNNNPPKKENPQPSRLRKGRKGKWLMLTLFWFNFSMNIWR